jgi:hypothetical protein
MERFFSIFFEEDSDAMHKRLLRLNLQLALHGLHERAIHFRRIIMRINTYSAEAYDLARSLMANWLA